MAEEQRYIISQSDGRRKVALLRNNEMLTLENFIDHLGMDIVQDLDEIREGKKKREETFIDLSMDVLNSLSGAVKALSIRHES